MVFVIFLELGSGVIDIGMLLAHISPSALSGSGHDVSMLQTRIVQPSNASQKVERVTEHNVPGEARKFRRTKSYRETSTQSGLDPPYRVRST